MNILPTGKYSSYASCESLLRNSVLARQAIKDRIRKYKYWGAKHLLGDNQSRRQIGPLILPLRPLRWVNIRHHASFHVSQGMIPRTLFSKKDWGDIRQFRSKLKRNADIDRIEIKQEQSRKLVGIRLQPLDNTATKEKEERETAHWKALCHFVTVIHDRSFIAATRVSYRHGYGKLNKLVEKYPAPEVVPESELIKKSRRSPKDTLIADASTAAACDVLPVSPTPAPLAKEVPPAREPLVLEGPPGIATVRKIWAFFTGKK